MSKSTNTKDELGEITQDQFYGMLDNIIMWCFTLGFEAARREYGEQYKSAKEAEPFYEDNLDSWIQDIMTGHEDLLAKDRQQLIQRIKEEVIGVGCECDLVKSACMCDRIYTSW